MTELPKPNLVVFDIDGVLADLTHGFSLLGRIMHGTPMGTQASQPTWGHLNLMTSAEEGDVWKVIYKVPQWWGSLQPCFSGEDWAAMWQLDNFGIHILYMTNRPKASEGVTVHWLQRHRLPKPHRLIVTNDKTVEIRQIQEEYNVLGIIDDSPKNLIPLRDAGIATWALARGYNVGIPGIEYADTIEAFVDQILTKRLSLPE